MVDWVGYRWLAEKYGVSSVQPLSVESQIGPSRRSIRNAGRTLEIYPAVFRPDDALSAHLTFALKHEGIHLEFLARLFERVPESDVRAWVNSERTGQYARRTGFLWEWLSGRELEDVPGAAGGNYVNAIDPEQYIAGTAPANNGRWRVRDNLPGSRAFCPIVRRTAAVIDAEAYDCAAELDVLQAEYGVDLLMRSAVWLTIKESRASFQIEHEEDLKDRIQRFAAVMERRCGRMENPLSRQSLGELQREILGERTTLTQFGLRESPVFVGGISGFQEEVHYVAPPAAEAAGMLGGMSAFIARTAGGSPLARAAVVAFGFVYIHPLADGNGRVHRFLVNDQLRRDGAVPAPFILPISATITHKAQERARYDAVLEIFSKPFMARYGDACSFHRNPVRYPDGVQSNFEFGESADALPAWRYPDLTEHVEYTARLVDRTIQLEMRSEAELLRAWGRARAAVKEVIEGPNADIDRIVRSVKENGGRISSKLIGEFPALANPKVASDLREAIANAFEPIDPVANKVQAPSANQPSKGPTRASRGR